MHPYDAEYNFMSRFPIGFRGCFICGSTNYFSREDFPVGLDGNNREANNIFFNELWAHKPHTKSRFRDGTPVSVGKIVLVFSMIHHDTTWY